MYFWTVLCGLGYEGSVMLGLELRLLMDTGVTLDVEMTGVFTLRSSRDLEEVLADLLCC